jgi:Domain of unknown function (DUF4263)
MSRLTNPQEEVYARLRVPGYFYVSQRFPEGGASHPSGSGRTCRFAYQVVDSTGEVQFESDKGWELVLRETPSRQQIKALFFEDTRHVQHLAIQRFSGKGAPLGGQVATFEAHEVSELASFLALVRSSVLDLAEHKDGIRLLPGGIEELLADESSQRALFNRYLAVFTELFEGDVNAPEIVAFARRKRQLEVFDQLLHNTGFFDARQAELKAAGRRHGPEHVWQEFFDANKWIFGSALAVQFLHSWKPDKLEQTTVGSSVFGAGKRPDAVMRTAGILSAFVFVEIKHHRTPLLEPHKDPYRSETWRASREVVGGIAQCQVTIDETIDSVQEREVAEQDSRGFPTGRRALLCRPRSILVVGALDEFVGEHGTNISMFEGFERLRRSLRDPEIVTFDEVYDRARLVLEMSETDVGQSDDT